MIPPVDGLIVIGSGIATLVLAIGVLRTFGSRFRVGRLLAATPLVSVAEALELAGRDSPTYVRVAGRIDSDSDFEDADHRPLVYRRTRLQARLGRAWKDFDVVVESVPFEINEGLDHIGVDAASLGDGLVVIPRETEGLVGDLGERAPEAIDDLLPARVVVEHISSVEHATILGVPTRSPGGATSLTAGMGRPLVLTTLEQPEAMRVLAGGDVKLPRLAAALLIAAGFLIIAGVILIILPGSALAASPDPTAVVGSDTRSSGEGPGLVGAPLAAILGVVGIGLLTMLLTLAWVRLTKRREGSSPDR